MSRYDFDIKEVNPLFKIRFTDEPTTHYDHVLLKNIEKVNILPLIIRIVGILLTVIGITLIFLYADNGMVMLAGVLLAMLPIRFLITHFKVRKHKLLTSIYPNALFTDDRIILLSPAGKLNTVFFYNEIKNAYETDYIFYFETTTESTITLSKEFIVGDIKSFRSFIGEHIHSEIKYHKIKTPNIKTKAAWVTILTLLVLLTIFIRPIREFIVPADKLYKIDAYSITLPKHYTTPAVSQYSLFQSKDNISSIKISLDVKSMSLPENLNGNTHEAIKFKFKSEFPSITDYEIVDQSDDTLYFEFSSNNFDVEKLFNIGIRDDFSLYVYTVITYKNGKFYTTSFACKKTDKYVYDASFKRLAKGIDVKKDD